MSKRTAGEPKHSAAKSSSQFTRHVAVTFGIAALIATVLTAWKPASLDPGELVGELMAAVGREHTRKAFPRVVGEAL